MRGIRPRAQPESGSLLFSFLALRHHMTIAFGLAGLQFTMLLGEAVYAMTAADMPGSSWAVMTLIIIEGILFCGLFFTALDFRSFGFFATTKARVLSVAHLLNRIYLVACTAHLAANGYYLCSSPGAPFAVMLVIQIWCLATSCFSDTYVTHQLNGVPQQPRVELQTVVIEIPVFKAPQQWSVQVVNAAPETAFDCDAVCGICYREYSEPEFARTMLHPCGHSFCSSCVQSLHARRFTCCPFCRTEVTKALEVREGSECPASPESQFSIRMSVSAEVDTLPGQPEDQNLDG